MRCDMDDGAGLSAITAAIVGVVVNLALWLALHVILGQVRSVGFGTEIPVLSSNRLACGPSLRCFDDRLN